MSNVLLHARLEERHADDDGPPGQAGHEARGLQRGAAGGELRQAREARAAARVEGRRDRLDRLRRGQHVRRRVGRREGRLRARGRRAAETRAGVGRRLQRRPLLPHRGRVRRPRRGVRRRPRHRRRAVPVAGGPRGHPAAGDERHRPVARPRLARARARLAGASRHAGPDALPRRRAPRLHHRQRPGARVPRLAARARHRARDRVPRPQRPDGAAAARAASATGAIPTTRRPRSSARCEERFTVERSAAISETRTIYEARP